MDDNNKQDEEVKLNTVNELQKQLDECKAKCEENLNGWKRAAADLINYKKEEFARAQELMLYTKERFLESLLPMLDNLNLTEKNMPPELLENASVKGLMMVKTQLEDFLKNSGVEAIDSLGKNFDPALHEVIQAVDVEGKESGTVVEEVVKGYMVNGRLLRPAKVKVVK
ncbi:MAG: nucleotide exchange factor GrpE [Candidatus Paceibacterota bacterium]